MLTSVPMKPRYAAPNPVTAEGWQLQTVTGPSRLFGANGLRTGPDGRVYVAQVTGSQISALDLDTGTLEVVSPKGGDIIAPDDVAFGTDGTLYATEVMDGRVSARDIDQTVEPGTGVRRNGAHLIEHGGDAVVGGRVGGHGDDGQPPRSQRPDVFVEVGLRATDRDDGGAGLGGHPRHRRSDAAATCAGDNHDAVVQPQRRFGTHVICPDKERYSA